MKIYNNGFQSLMDAKIQREICFGNFGSQSEKTSKLVSDYIQGIPFSGSTQPFDVNVHANAKMAKDNFVNYWTRVLALNEDNKCRLENIWEDSICAESDCEGINGPVLILNGKGAMTQDSFFNMIYQMFNC